MVHTHTHTSKLRGFPFTSSTDSVGHLWKSNFNNKRGVKITVIKCAVSWYFNFQNTSNKFEIIGAFSTAEFSFGCLYIVDDVTSERGLF